MKKSNKIAWISLALIVVAGLFAFGVSQTYSGATILSISNAKFLTNSPDAQGENAFLIDVVVNKGGESLAGEITPEDLKSYGLTQIPSGPIKVYFNLKNVSCNYDIAADDLTIYKMYQATVRKSLCGQRCLSGCSDRSSCPYGDINLETVKANCRGDWFVAGVHNPEFCNKVFAPTGTNTASPGAAIAGGSCDSIVNIQQTPIRPELGMEASEWCYAMPAEILQGWDGDHWRVTHIGGIPWFSGYKIGTIASPTFEVEVIVENSEGDKVSAVLSNKETSKFLSDIGKVKWVGNLVAQQYCGVPSVDKAVVRDLNTNAMKVISKNYYDDYKSKFFELINFDNNYYATVATDPGVGADVLWDKMSTLNALHRNIYDEDIKDNCVIQGMQYVCTPTQDIIYPELQLTLKASWIGIVIPNGNPKINDVTVAPKIFDGEASFVKVDIENIGKELDSFDIYMDCGNEISLGSVRKSLAAGEKDYVNLNFVADVGKYNCLAIMYSLNNPMARDEKAFTLDIKERDTPKPQSCEDIPEQPCDKALWQAYPICGWNTQFCQDEKPFPWMYVIIGGIGITVLLVIMTKLSKPRRKKRK